MIVSSTFVVSFVRILDWPWQTFRPKEICLKPQDNFSNTQQTPLRKNIGLTRRPRKSLSDRVILLPPAASHQTLKRPIASLCKTTRGVVILATLKTMLYVKEVNMIPLHSLLPDWVIFERTLLQISHTQ